MGSTLQLWGWDSAQDELALLVRCRDWWNEEGGSGLEIARADQKGGEEENDEKKAFGGDCMVIQG
jgi:hypothetical protein